MAVKVAIIYYSATGTTYRLARAVEDGASEGGADVRLRKVRELAPEEAIASTRYGLPTAQLKQFLDTTGPLWVKGALVNKICSAFTSSGTAHGGQETTIVNVNTPFITGARLLLGQVAPTQFNSKPAILTEPHSLVTMARLSRTRLRSRRRDSRAGV
jgi:NAD(P)H dehydrogenase (quinone)